MKYLDWIIYYFLELVDSSLNLFLALFCVRGKFKFSESYFVNREASRIKKEQEALDRARHSKSDSVKKELEALRYALMKEEEEF